MKSSEALATALFFELRIKNNIEKKDYSSENISEDILRLYLFKTIKNVNL